MSVTKASTAKDNSRSFAETSVDLTNNDGKLSHVSRQVPRFGSVRSRIVLVDRAGTLSGLEWEDMERQDRFNTPAEIKAKLILSHVEKLSK